MIQPKNIHTLTEFKRTAAQFRERLKKSGLPAVLTVKGRPELVLQDVGAYQKLVDALERAQALEGIRSGLESIRLGHGKPAKEFFSDLRSRLGLLHRFR